MAKLKSYKTVEQIAKKHRLDASFIQNQLDMGEPIEHEHTNNHELARDIALQHLDEIPDYYTRLKKMEAEAKKNHKKFKDVKEQCGCEKDVVKELEIGLKKLNNISYQSIDNLMRQIMKKNDMTAKQLHNVFVSKHNKTPDEWIKNLKEETKSGDEGLGDWIRKSSARDPKTGRKVPGWTQIGGPFAGAPCARQPGQTSTPKCGSSKMAANLSPKEEDEAFRRKNRKDPNQPEKRNAAKPTNVRTEGMDLHEKKKSEKKDACYHKVKSRYDVWPSAYASLALVKCRKVGAKNWGNKNESYPTIVERIIGEEKCGKGMYWCNTDEVCKPIPAGFNTPGQSIKPTEVGIGKPVEGPKKCNNTKRGVFCDIHGKNECSIKESNEKDHEHSMARSELSTIASAVKRLKKKMKGEGNIEAWVQSKITKAADYLDAAADYIDSGEMDVDESKSFIISSNKKPLTKPQQKLHNMTPKQRVQLPPEMVKKLMGPVDLPPIDLNKEECISTKLIDEIINEKCWTGYKKKGMKKMFGKKYPNCVKTEDITIEDSEGNAFAEVIDLIKPEPIKGFKSQVNEATRLQSQTGNVIATTISWRGKYYYIKMFFPQIKLPTRKELNDELKKVYPGCVVIHHTASEIQPGQPLIQVFGPQGGSSAKLGPNKNYIKPMSEQFQIDEDWQKVNRKDKTDGLSQKAVNAYRKENPGSKLQTAVTEKNPTGKRANRRKSFCKRMSGMKSKLTSAKTARDPDSRINKALRRWNCN